MTEEKSESFGVDQEGSKARTGTHAPEPITPDEYHPDSTFDEEHDRNRRGGSGPRTKAHPATNKFHVGNGTDGKHYWLTPSALYAELDAQYAFDFDPCPYPKADDFDGLTAEWGQSNYVNPPFGSVMHEGKKKGPTAWARKAIAENAKGKRVVLVYPIDKWVLMLLAAGASVRNLGDVRWCATEDGTPGRGTGRHIAAFILEPPPLALVSEDEVAA